MTKANSYRLLTYQGQTGPRVGLLVDDTVLDLEQALTSYSRLSGNGAIHAFAADSVLSVLQSWELARPVLSGIAESERAGKITSTAHSLSEVKLLAPILYPGALFCATANYVDHILEMRKVPAPDKATTRPCFFLKTTVHSIIGSDAEAHISRASDKVFWEGELGVVIGKPARYVKKSDALSYVAGYVIVNDLSDTTDFLARRKDKYGEWFGHDWFRVKNFDTAAPMGPWITSGGGSAQSSRSFAQHHRERQADAEWFNQQHAFQGRGTDRISQRASHLAARRRYRNRHLCWNRSLAGYLSSRW